MSEIFHLLTIKHIAEAATVSVVKDVPYARRLVSEYRQAAANRLKNGQEGFTEEQIATAGMIQGISHIDTEHSLDNQLAFAAPLFYSYLTSEAAGFSSDQQVNLATDFKFALLARNTSVGQRRLNEIKQILKERRIAVGLSESFDDALQTE